MNRPLIVLATVALAAAASTQQDSEGWRAGVLFTEAADELSRRFYDEEFRETRLPELIEKYQPAADGSTSLREERKVVHRFLSEIPASHLALYSEATYQRLIGGLQNRAVPQFGVQLTAVDGQYFVRDLLAGGPAERVGLCVGDRIVTIDASPPAESARLDWRSDDAYLDDAPTHEVLCSGVDDAVTLAFQRERGGAVASVEVLAEKFSVFDAAAASVRVIERDDRKIGYLRLWMIHIRDVGELLRDAVASDFADCDGWILDLRGRGGAAHVVPVIERELRRAQRREGFVSVALIDRDSRSAKEVIADRIKREKLATLVGEATRGAVLPASFERLSYGHRLMYPRFVIEFSPERLEGRGVEPDVAATMPGPYAAGHDPILEAGIRTVIERASR